MCILWFLTGEHNYSGAIHLIITAHALAAATCQREKDTVYKCDFQFFIIFKPNSNSAIVFQTKILKQVFVFMKTTNNQHMQFYWSIKENMLYNICCLPLKYERTNTMKCPTHDQHCELPHTFISSSKQNTFCH